MGLPALRDRTSLAALAGYALISFAYFGLPLLPHFGRSYIGYGVDPEIFIWSFEWWPHAILHWENPFVTHAIWAPDGQNLTWTTTPPGLALPLAPLTLAAGPVVSYNVTAILLPALAAWTAYLLCRYLTRSAWAALVGGYLFGFSSYILGQTQGHMHMTSVFLLPLVALVVLRYVGSELARRALVLRLGALLAVQLLFSTAVSFTLGLAFVTALTVALIAVPEVRPRVVSLVPAIVAAYALAAVLTAPFLYYALTDFESDSINDQADLVADVVNLVVPTQLLLWGGGASYDVTRDFTGNDSENTAYLGLPALVIVGSFAWRRRRTAGARFLLPALGCTLVAAFGPSLHLAGDHVVTMPWSLVADLPLFNNAPPVRLTVYLALIAAVVVALWTASVQARWLRVGVPLLAIVALLPAPHRTPWKVTPPWPAFFTAGTYERCLHPGENTLVFPFGQHGDSMLWQAAGGFHFRMAGGYLNRRIPEAFVRFPGVEELVRAARPLDLRAPALLDLARAKGVTAIVVEEQRSEPWRTLLRGVPPPRVAHGVLLYSLGGNRPPGCDR